MAKREGEPVPLTVRDFCLVALKGGDADDCDVPRRIRRAVRYYFADRASDRPDWPYPSAVGAALEGDEEATSTVSVDFESALWEALSAEAERQGVEAERLVEHATLYFAADRDAGRITSRILGAIDAEER